MEKLSTRIEEGVINLAWGREVAFRKGFLEVGRHLS